MVNWSNMDERPDRYQPKTRKDGGYWMLWLGAVIVAIMFLVYALGTGGWWL